MESRGFEIVGWVNGSRKLVRAQPESFTSQPDEFGPSIHFPESEVYRLGFGFGTGGGQNTRQQPVVNVHGHFHMVIVWQHNHTVNPSSDNVMLS